MIRFYKGIPLFLIVFSFGFSSFALGHHSVAAEYGKMPQIEIEGKITELYWHEPHARIRMEITGGALPMGEVWDVTTHSPGILARNYDFPPSMVKVGDQVKVKGRVSQFGLPRFALYSIAVNGSDFHLLSPVGASSVSAEE